MKVGDRFEFSRVVTDELIQKFGELSGDYNPIHFDEEFASQTRFGKRIGHGLLTASFLSALLGSSMSVNKLVYLSQTLRFRNPAYIGDKITAVGIVKKVREDKPIVTIETVCTNQDGSVVIDGEAVVMLLD
ncbi:MAG: MaoC family dehydratase [Pyrinomonadaceae bacterium]